MWKQLELPSMTQMVNSTSKYSISKEDFHYIEEGIHAKDHTPIYKMHKYFARRPHNVFRYLIEAYTEPEDIILDCFLGGGVTLVEGLSIGRKVIGVDINPLATFVSSCQTTLVSIEEYQKVLKEVWQNVRKLTKHYYSTRCRKCGNLADVRWYELAYTVICSVKECRRKTLLSHSNKVVRDGKVINGRYICQHCNSEFSAVDAAREGYELISVTYKCPCISGRQTTEPDDYDIALMQEVEEEFEGLITKYGLWYPQNKIPEEWDRQHEDCLYRKSIKQFSNFFTKRTLFFNAYLLHLFQSYRFKVTPELYKMLLFTFSAIIRYTNNMTFSTGNWMDGRPVAWAKHAYWTPYQFAEVNPLEYVEKRRTAIVSGLKFQQKYLHSGKSNSVTEGNSFSELKSGKATHIIWTRSSSNLDIPDESIAAVITDPPYGSNVQYGELSSFWLVWLQNDLPLDDALLSLEEDEIVVQRKVRKKDYEDYFLGLRAVFEECFRVLRYGGVLVFTFNNKDIRAWFSVIKAAIKTGFYLDPRGVIYQEPIENYSNTAHTRYAGSLHGDFIYTFRKLDCHSSSNTEVNILEMVDEDTIKDKIRKTIEQYLYERGFATTSQLYIHVISELIPVMVSVAENEKNFAHLSTLIDAKNLDSLLNQHFEFKRSDKMWHLRSVTQGS